MSTMSLPIKDQWALHYPALSELSLTEKDIEVLRYQGTVASEMRRGKPLYRLRFRRDGKQYARYIGFDARRAESLHRELEVLQQETQQRLRLRQLARAARKKLRDARQSLAPVLPPGYCFHGHIVRKRRTLNQLLT